MNSLGSTCNWTWAGVSKSSGRIRRRPDQLIFDVTNSNFKLILAIQNLVTLVMVSDAHHIPIGIELNFKFESSSMWYIIVPNITFKGLFINYLSRHSNSAPRCAPRWPSLSRHVTCPSVQTPSRLVSAQEGLFHAVVLNWEMASVMHCYLSRSANHCDVSLDGYLEMFSSKPDPIMKRIIRNIKSRIDILIFSSFPVKANKSYWSFLTLVPKNMWSLENMSERECL